MCDAINTNGWVWLRVMQDRLRGLRADTSELCATVTKPAKKQHFHGIHAALADMYAFWPRFYMV